jgi:hypothetical protein
MTPSCSGRRYTRRPVYGSDQIPVNADMLRYNTQLFSMCIEYDNFHY